MTQFSAKIVDLVPKKVVGKPTMNKISAGVLTAEEAEMFDSIIQEAEAIDKILKKTSEQKAIIESKSKALWNFIQNNHNYTNSRQMFIENHEVFYYKVENIPEKVMERLTQ